MCEPVSERGGMTVLLASANSSKLALNCRARDGPDKSLVLRKRQSAKTIKKHIDRVVDFESRE